jgi:hypothetical protein
LAGLIIQFHAHLGELKEFIERATTSYGLFATALWPHPFRARVVNSADLGLAIQDPAMRDIAFSTSAPRLDAAHLLDFIDKNEGVLILSIGRLISAGLDESCLSTTTDDIEKLAIWKKVASDLRKQTKVGAQVVNPETGATSFSRSHRYTAGAKTLGDGGVAILPASRRNRLRL